MPEAWASLPVGEFTTGKFIEMPLIIVLTIGTMVGFLFSTVSTMGRTVEWPLTMVESWLTTFVVALVTSFASLERKLPGTLLRAAVAVGRMFPAAFVRPAPAVGWAFPRTETSAFAVLRRPPARPLMLVGVADKAVIALLMIVISSTFTVSVPVAPKTPSRQSLAIMTTDPSTHIIVPVSMDTAEPRGWSVERLEGVVGEVTRSDATGLRRPLPPDVGLGIQKYPSLQLAQAQPYPQIQFCAGVCWGGQNHPSGHSEHEYPAFGHGCVEVGEPARYETNVELFRE
jgi:hypothetical protein